MSGDGAAGPVTTLRIVAVVVERADGRHLLVRKRGTQSFMQVGGKIEPGEEPLAALLREVEEEVGLQLDPADVESLGRFGAPAANEPDHVVDAYAYRVRLRPDVEIVVRAELEELVWIDPADPVTRYPIAPLSRDLLVAAGH
ncbi:NUDIX domain-containing protein [Promicromonospora thailandica]|uniref:ADP-ribose pyrophosphatase YjhB, NUDIX family n=1 Tax=Promicromonospora thailandica TaxID=765201 RepID=A0A9X2G3E9_9MICO|nr:NUDIX domain-containing protein [Promicromonospora thailandica]MCP2266365.1 ADP-ribose pyrophosphatase YjhB, NUDIX family [Promicromonospora thailandica]BFF20043.1 NUDIX domain-containing protein [Promicromonospora thailandica]